jgi:hypothetical protein
MTPVATGPLVPAFQCFQATHAPHPCFGCRRDDGTSVHLLDLYSSSNLTVPVFVNGTWQQRTVPTVTITLEYLGSSAWGDGVLDAYSNLVNNCWGALTTSTAWLGDKYDIVGCNVTVGM